jgi:uncharacterized repeat protein (TIGR03803 family)
MSFTKLIQAALLLLVGLAALPSGWAQTYKVLHSFKGGTDGAYPFAGLVRDSAGNLYGTTVGADQGALPGSVFKVGPGGGFTVLHSFKYGGAEARPGTLVQDSAGNLYGATIVWGTSPSTIFKLTKTGRFSVLHTFTAGSGAGGTVGAGGTLTLDSVGNLYGTGGDNSACGGHGCGFIFKLDPSGNETVLHYFPGGKRGTGPNGGLIRDAATPLRLRLLPQPCRESSLVQRARRQSHDGLSSIRLAGLEIEAGVQGRERQSQTPSACCHRYRAAQFAGFIPVRNVFLSQLQTIQSTLELEMTDPRKPPRSVRSQDLRFKIETERETDGRWIAEISDLPGVLAYGKTEAEANAKAYALALRVIADDVEKSKKVPASISVTCQSA